MGRRYFFFQAKDGIRVLVRSRGPDMYISELPKEAYDSLMSFSQRVAKALKLSVPCKRIGSMVLGMEVPHAHIHLVPINAESELSFTNGYLSFTQAEMLELASTISDALDSVE